MTADPSTVHRATLRDELFNRFFLIAAGSAGLTATSVPSGPPCPTSRELTPATHSPGARDCRNREPKIKLIMAGHDATLAQWFHQPAETPRLRTGRTMVQRTVRHQGLPARALVVNYRQPVPVRRRHLFVHRRLGLSGRSEYSCWDALPFV